MKVFVRHAMKMLALMLYLHASDIDAKSREAVTEVSPDVVTISGRGLLHLYLSQNWSAPAPTVTRAVVVSTDFTGTPKAITITGGEREKRLAGRAHRRLSSRRFF